MKKGIEYDSVTNKCSNFSSEKYIFNVYQCIEYDYFKRKKPMEQKRVENKTEIVILNRRFFGG
jgi:hypothetical protein